VLSLPDAIDVARPSVVQICIADNQMKTMVAGTGFIVDQGGYVLTAGHVTRGANEIIKTNQIADGRIVIGLSQPSTATMRANFTFVGCEVVEEDLRHDLALVRMNPNPFEGGVSSGLVINGSEVPLLFDVATRSSDQLRDGTPIAVSGYPLSELVLITTSGALASAWGFEIARVPIPGAPAGFSIPDVRNSYLADISVNPGNSGGPAYRISDGAVIGVCVAFRNVPLKIANGPVLVNGEPLQYNSGLSVIVPISYGEELIARNVDPSYLSYEVEE
jgi:S1-C subfamily serine protease